MIFRILDFSASPLYHLDNTCGSSRNRRDETSRTTGQVPVAPLLSPTTSTVVSRKSKSYYKRQRSSRGRKGRRRRRESPPRMPSHEEEGYSTKSQETWLEWKRCLPEVLLENDSILGSSSDYHLLLESISKSHGASQSSMSPTTSLKEVSTSLTTTAAANSTKPIPILQDATNRKSSLSLLFLSSSSSSSQEPSSSRRLVSEQQRQLAMYAMADYRDERMYTRIIEAMLKAHETRPTIDSMNTIQGIMDIRRRHIQDFSPSVLLSSSSPTAHSSLFSWLNHDRHNTTTTKTRIGHRDEVLPSWHEWFPQGSLPHETDHDDRLAIPSSHHNVSSQATTATNHATTTTTAATTAMAKQLSPSSRTSNHLLGTTAPMDREGEEHQQEQQFVSLLPASSSYSTTFNTLYDHLPPPAPLEETSTTSTMMMIFEMDDI